MVDPKPEIADDGFVTVALMDPEVYPGTDGATDGVGVEDTTSDDIGTDTTLVETDGEVIGRPLDPEPNWRTLTGEGEEDQPVIACVDYPIYTADGTDLPLVVDKDAVVDDTGLIDVGTTDIVAEDEPVIYTLDDSDPLIYATTGGELPGRPSDPLPFWRTNSVPAVTEVEVDPAPVHYAAADTFHTGLDLL
jgi:hypothetical protein